MINTSSFPSNQTANTNFACAHQRAENLAILGARKVIELCCGPSLPTLTKAYKKFGIEVWGNDIERRYQEENSSYPWLIGDCFQIDVSPFDFVVFAPPLSKGCSGRREDSLRLDQVVPSYFGALTQFTKRLCLVLPGRTLSVRKDREQLYRLLASTTRTADVVPLQNHVTKYVDLYVDQING